MSDKIARLGITRDNDLMYFIKNGDVWATPRKQPGQPKGKPRKVADVGIELDYSKYLYFLDGDGDVARKARNNGSGKRSKTKAPKAPKTLSKKARAAAGGGTSGKSPADLEREIAECLARDKKANGGAVASTASARKSKSKKSSR